MDSDVASVTQQLADLTELKLARQRRAQMRRGSPEWLAALGVEERLITQIQRWARQRHVLRDAIDGR